VKISPISRILFIIVLLCLSFSVSARVFYISPNGNDITGDGSNISPWKSLANATNKVKTPGDTIYLKAGVYNETIASKLAVGVSVIGTGNSSVITSTLLVTEWNPIIDMRSASLADGNQSISYLKFDGDNLTAAMAVWISRRNNVVIHHCVFVDFHYTGIYWTGDGGTETTPPINYVKGSKFYNNIMTNCAAYTNAARGALNIGGHEGMLIYENNISQTGRKPGTNGWPIKIWPNGGWVKGLKIFNNVLFKDDTSLWDFCIEGNWIFGIEIYNNIITGSIDLNHVSKNSYEYGAYIHNNTLGPQTSSVSFLKGIILEWDQCDIVIRYNHFRNLYCGIHYTPRDSSKIMNQEISYNLFDNIGNNGGGWGIIRLWEDTERFILGTFNIYNNIFYAFESNPVYYGVGIGGYVNGNEINIINNIFVNIGYYWFYGKSGDNLSTLNIKNNILFNNVHRNNIKLDGTPLNYSNTGNKSTNPDFDSKQYFHPKSDSPSIDAGINISGLAFDLDGISIGNPPNIGCYETISDNQSNKMLKFPNFFKIGLFMLLFLGILALFFLKRRNFSNND